MRGAGAGGVMYVLDASGSATELLRTLPPVILWPKTKAKAHCTGCNCKRRANPPGRQSD